MDLLSSCVCFWANKLKNQIKSKKMSRILCVHSVIMIYLVSMSFVVKAHIFKDYKSKEHVLTSVYDAMRGNVQPDLRQMNDSRNKRNIVGNEKLVEYYDNQPSDSSNE